jgi:hypothetical protein
MIVIRLTLDAVKAFAGNERILVKTFPDRDIVGALRSNDDGSTHSRI